MKFEISNESWYWKFICTSFPSVISLPEGWILGDDTYFPHSKKMMCALSWYHFFAWNIFLINLREWKMIRAGLSCWSTNPQFSGNGLYPAQQVISHFHKFILHLMSCTLFSCVSMHIYFVGIGFSWQPLWSEPELASSSIEKNLRWQKESGLSHHWCHQLWHLRILCLSPCQRRVQLGDAFLMGATYRKRYGKLKESTQTVEACVVNLLLLGIICESEKWTTNLIC